MISPQKHDYISFTRRVVPAVRAKSRGVYGANHDYVLEDENFAPCVGQGQVLSVSKNSKVIRGELCPTARVATGGAYGTITVILDDTCEIVGEQYDFFGSEFDAMRLQASMYDVRGDGA